VLIIQEVAVIRRFFLGVVRIFNIFMALSPRWRNNSKSSKYAKGGINGSSWQRDCGKHVFRAGRLLCDQSWVLPVFTFPAAIRIVVLELFDKQMGDWL
jgi:hypothetical protein